MNRRNFLKSIGKVVAGCVVLPMAGKTGASEAKPQLTVAKLMEAKKALDATIDNLDEFDLFTGYRTKKPSVHCEICDEDCPHFLQCHDSRYVDYPAYIIKEDGLIEKIPYWKFYINGKEIDSNRAIDENGCLSLPFQGAKKRDVCTAKSPKIFL